MNHDPMKLARIAAFAIVAAASAIPVHAETYKIGVLNIEQILRQSKAAQAAQARIEQEFKARDADLSRKEQDVQAAAAAFAKDRPTLSADEAARRERDAASTPLSGGPFKEFLAALHRIQADFPEDRSPIRTALVTARSAPAHERVIRTLRAWNIRIDEALFLGGLDKGEFLRAFGADIFFDDQRTHVESAAKHVATGHVPHGIANE